MGEKAFLLTVSFAAVVWSPHATRCLPDRTTAAKETFIILLFAEGSPLSGFYLVYVVSQDEVSTGCVLCILPHQCLVRNSPKTPVLSNVCNYRFGLVTFLSHQFGYKRWQTDTIWKHHAATMLFVPGGETWMSSLKSQCVWLFNFFVCLFAFLFCWFSCL